MLRIATSLLAAAAVAAAVDGATGPENSTVFDTQVGEITVHKITVGRAENSFYPNSIQAKAGDIVSFEFYPSNHSVIRSTYGYPCIPYESIFEDGKGFTSGPMPVSSSGVLPTWNVTINNTDPVFFYCGAPGSCFGWGMLGVINANNATDLSKQIAIARQEAYEIWPGETVPGPALASLGAIAATATLAPSSTSSMTSPSSTSTSVVASSMPTTTVAASSSPNISGGAIGGVAIGAVALLIIAAGLFFFFRRRRQANKDDSTQRQSYHAPPVWSGRDMSYYGSQGPPSSQLPPYGAPSHKEHYADQSVYDVGETVQTPPLPYSDGHQSYMEYRSANGSPPPRLSARQSIASELDSAAHSQPVAQNLNAIPELDTRSHHVASIT